MLSVFILLILAWHFYIGYSRGIILQAYYFVASIVSLVVASRFYQALSEEITLWIPYSNAGQGASMNFFTDINIFDLDRVYYAGVALTAIYMLVYAIFRFIGILVHLAPVHHFDSVKLNCLSGIMAVLVALVFFGLVLTLLATVPMSMVQNLLSSSWIARLIINYFQPLTGVIKALWVTAILG
ncbi:putative membrane protein, required for colicin V production [Streptococcus infantarius subsp. infantarius]|nr:putative membrane protein, required for colicin V production [Streptococcus infantarius subsp. infantarius]